MNPPPLKVFKMLKLPVACACVFKQRKTRISNLPHRPDDPPVSHSASPRRTRRTPPVGAPPKVDALEDVLRRGLDRPRQRVGHR